LTWALLAAAALLAGAALPGPQRGPARAVLGFALVLSPLAPLAVFLAGQRPEPGTWLLFGPLALAWLAAVDLFFGVSARLARRPAGLGRRGRVRGPAGGPAGPEEGDAGSGYPCQ
jgi:hypothetical protein